MNAAITLRNAVASEPVQIPTNETDPERAGFDVVVAARVVVCGGVAFLLEPPQPARNALSIAMLARMIQLR